MTGRIMPRTRMLPTSRIDYELITVRPARPPRPRRLTYVAVTVIEDQEVCEGGLDAILYDIDGISDIPPRRMATGISAERAPQFVRRLHEAATYLEQTARHLSKRAGVA